MNRFPGREWIGGATLIVIGLALLASHLLPGWDRIVVLVVGLVLLATFGLTRWPGALISGGIISGVGLGIVLASGMTGTTAGTLFMVSLGCGFLLVAVLGWLADVRGARWWPLVPGAILVGIGVAIAAGDVGQQVLRAAGDWWPIVLVALGLWMVIAAAVRSEGRRGGGSGQAVSHPGEQTDGGRRSDEAGAGSNDWLVGRDAPEGSSGGGPGGGPLQPPDVG